MRDPALLRAIDAAGGPAKLAAEIGVTRQAISQWDRAPAERVLQIEKAAGGVVNRHDLRPDLYPLETAAE